MPRLDLVGTSVFGLGLHLGFPEWVVASAGIASAFVPRVVGVIRGRSAPRTPWS